MKKTLLLFAIATMLSLSSYAQWSIGGSIGAVYDRPFMHQDKYDYYYYSGDYLEAIAMMDKYISFDPEAYFGLLNESDDKTDNDKSEKKSRGGMIKVGIGPEWNTSKVYYEGSNYLSYIRGNAVSLSVTSTGGKAYGFGFDLYGSITEADIPSYSYSSYDKFDLTLLYLGPSAVFGGHLTDRLRMDLVVSTGVAYFQDNDYTQIGIGLKSALGLEYMVSKNAGIGLDLLGMTSIFGNPSGARLPNNEVYGYRQLGLMLTGRFHF